MLEVTGSIRVDESTHDVTFCTSDVDPSVVPHQELHNQLNESAPPPVDDSFINNDTKHIESSNEESSKVDEQNSE